MAQLDVKLEATLHLKVPQSLLDDMDKKALTLSLSRSDYARIVLTLGVKEKDICLVQRNSKPKKARA